MFVHTEMHFRMLGLPAERFADLFALSAIELSARAALRRRADRKPGFPCRLGLTDAEVGDEVILVNHVHLCVESPYRASHAIYVRAGEQTFDACDKVPEMLRGRLLSVRGFDAQGMMTGCEVVERTWLERVITQLLAAPEAQYLQIHLARRGCYAARVERVSGSPR